MTSKAAYTDLHTILLNNQFSYIKACAALIPKLDRQFLACNIRDIHGSYLDSPVEFISAGWGFGFNPENGNYTIEYSIYDISKVATKSQVWDWFCLPYSKNSLVYKIDNLIYIGNMFNNQLWLDAICSADQMIKNRIIFQQGHESKCVEVRFFEPEIIEIPGWL
jgi:hypothetical protein